MPKPTGSNVKQSLTLPRKLAAHARDRAKKLGLSFSAFVQKSLERDLAESPDAILSESGGEAALAPGSPKPRKPRKA
jgi:hypothetical protein